MTHSGKRRPPAKAMPALEPCQIKKLLLPTGRRMFLRPIQKHKSQSSVHAQCAAPTPAQFSSILQKRRHHNEMRPPLHLLSAMRSGSLSHRLPFTASPLAIAKLYRLVTYASSASRSSTKPSSVRQPHITTSHSQSSCRTTKRPTDRGGPRTNVRKIK